MIDKKFTWIRNSFALAAFILMLSILLGWILDKAGTSSYRWHPRPIEILLFIVSFLMLANGVSYLSEIFKKKKNAIKVFTGILAMMVFAFALFPQNQGVNPLVGGGVLAGVSLCSIFISLCSTLEWAHKRIKWLLSFAFAFIGGIHAWIISAFILRGSANSESGTGLIGYAAIVFLFSTTVNLGVLSSLKKDARGN